MITFEVLNAHLSTKQSCALLGHLGASNEEGMTHRHLDTRTAFPISCATRQPRVREGQSCKTNMRSCYATMGLQFLLCSLLFFLVLFAANQVFSYLVLVLSSRNFCSRWVFAGFLNCTRRDCNAPRKVPNHIMSSCPQAG